MSLNLPTRKWAAQSLLLCALGLGASSASAQDTGQLLTAPAQDAYVPMDSWVYNALDRLRGLGYLDTAFMGLRPWTRRSIERMLTSTDTADGLHDDPQAEEIFTSLKRSSTSSMRTSQHRGTLRAWRSKRPTPGCRAFTDCHSRDSFHLGQTDSQRLWPAHTSQASTP